VPQATIVEIAPAEQARRLAEWRRARYGYLLALHLLLLCAARHTPTELAAVLFCARSTVYGVVRAYRAGDLEGLEEEGAGSPLARRTGLSPALRGSVLAILQAAPRACGWGRTRWSCATVALEVRARRGAVGAAETVRRWLQALGGEGKRAKLVAKAADPQRVEKWARIRSTFARVRAGRAWFFADEWDLSLLPKVGYHWMPKGEQGEVLTPGTKEKRYVAGALDIATGTTQPWVWYSKTPGVFRDLRATRERTYPAPQFSRLSVVVDNSKIPYAGESAKGLAAHPRFALLSLPTYGPKANPIERAFGEVQDKCTRHHTRKRMGPLVQDVEQPLAVNGPWP
jgi:hypothetical protein